MREDSWEKPQSKRSYERMRKQEKFFFRMEHPEYFADGNGITVLQIIYRTIFRILHFVKAHIFVILAVIGLIGGACRFPVPIHQEIPILREDTSEGLVQENLKIQGILWKHSFAGDYFVGTVSTETYKAKIKGKYYTKPAGFGYSGYRPFDIMEKDVLTDTNDVFHYWSNAYVYGNFQKIILLGHDTYVAGPVDSKEQYQSFQKDILDISKKR